MNKMEKTIKIHILSYRKLKKYANENGYKLKAMADRAIDAFIAKKEKEKEQLSLLDKG